MARPSKFTDELAERFLNIVQAGNTRRAACRATGIDPSTLHRWLQRKEKAFRDFAIRLEQAESVAERMCVALILNGAKRDPKHAQWYLERRHPREWGRRQWEGQLDEHGEPLSPTVEPSRVLVVPSVIDDIHEWSENAKRQVENSNAAEAARQAELDGQWQAFLSQNESRIREEIRIELSRELEVEANRSLARQGKLRNRRA